MSEPLLSPVSRCTPDSEKDEILESLYAIIVALRKDDPPSRETSLCIDRVQAAMVWRRRELENRRDAGLPDFKISLTVS